jgi:LmbE family N-acetylglucosaminyl deacetylase
VKGHPDNLSGLRLKTKALRAQSGQFAQSGAAFQPERDVQDITAPRKPFWSAKLM